MMRDRIEQVYEIIYYMIKHINGTIPDLWTHISALRRRPATNGRNGNIE